MRVAAEGVYAKDVTVSGRMFRIPWIAPGDLPEASTMEDILYRPSGITAGSGNVLIEHIETKRDIIAVKGARKDYYGGAASQSPYDQVDLPLLSSSAEWHAEETAIGPRQDKQMILFVEYRTNLSEPRILYGYYSYSVWNGWDLTCYVIRPYQGSNVRNKNLYAQRKLYYRAAGFNVSQTEAHSILSGYLDAWALDTIGFNNFGVVCMDAEISVPHTYYPTRGEEFYFHCHGVESMGFAARNVGIRNAGFTRAYYTAFDNLPQAKQNLIANICDIVGAIKSFSKGFKKLQGVLEAGKEAWLSYRYVYNTTISDAKEIEKLMERLYDLTTSSSDLVSYGGCTMDGITYHCAIVIDATQFVPSNILEGFKRFGGRINLTNAWDLVPFSFMVDWFFDVSSILESFDTWIESSELPIKQIWYSFNSVYEDCRTSVYGRWAGSKPALPPYQSTSSSASGKTIVMRVADVLSIFF